MLNEDAVVTMSPAQSKDISKRGREARLRRLQRVLGSAVDKCEKHFSEAKEANA